MKGKEKARNRKIELMKCKKCMGKGGIIKTDFKKAKNVEVTCPECHGAGYREQDTGISLQPIPGKFLWVKKKVNKQEVAWMQISLTYAHDKLKKESYAIVSIFSMKTAEGFRRKGYMDEMIQVLKNTGNKMVRYIYTSWDDSTEGGKEFLLKRGFVHKDLTLVWERPSDTKGDEGEAKQSK